jgi:hypothetical protein
MVLLMVVMGVVRVVPVTRAMLVAVVLAVLHALAPLCLCPVRLVRTFYA